MTNTVFKCFINCPVETAVRSPQKTLVWTEPWLVLCLVYGPQRAGVKKASCRELLKLLKFPSPLITHHQLSGQERHLPGFIFFLSLPSHLSFSLPWYASQDHGHSQLE